MHLASNGALLRLRWSLRLRIERVIGVILDGGCLALKESLRYSSFQHTHEPTRTDLGLAFLRSASGSWARETRQNCSPRLPRAALPLSALAEALAVDPRPCEGVFRRCLVF